MAHMHKLFTRRSTALIALFTSSYKPLRIGVYKNATVAASR